VQPRQHPYKRRHDGTRGDRDGDRRSLGTARHDDFGATLVTAHYCGGHPDSGASTGQ